MGSLDSAVSRDAARLPRAQYRRLCRGFEPLESRNLLAVLGLGIELRDNNLDLITTVDPGQEFWLYVLVEDQRAAGEGAPAGVISLPASLSWDNDLIELLAPINPAVEPNSELLTSRFPLQRDVDSYNPDAGHTGRGNVTTPPTPPVINDDDPFIANIVNLRGGAIPNAGQGMPIGVPDNSVPDGDPDPAVIFSRLHFRVNSTIAATTNSLFTIDVVGSMSFADAAALDDVAQLSAALIQERPPGFDPVVDQELLTVTEFFQINAPPPVEHSLSGCVFIDSNIDGVMNRDAGGRPLEMGLAGVTISLSGPESATVVTAADGSYRFDDLQPGTYTITETQPPGFIDFGSFVGTIDGVSVGTAGVNTISNIVLPAGAGKDGVDYCFAEGPIPDKRFFLASTEAPEILVEQLRIPAATVRGTPGNDTIRVENSLAGMRVTVNNQQPRFFSMEQARVLFIKADEGEDTVEFVGTDGDEVVQLAPGEGMMRRGVDYSGVNYSVMAMAAEHLIADGRLGNDFAALFDSPLNDALVASGNTTKVTAANGRSAEVRGMETVRALSLVNSGSGDTDTADVDTIDFVLDIVGDWQTI